MQRLRQHPVDLIRQFGRRKRFLNEIEPLFLQEVGYGSELAVTACYHDFQVVVYFFEALQNLLAV